MSSKGSPPPSTSSSGVESRSVSPRDTSSGKGPSIATSSPPPRGPAPAEPVPYPPPTSSAAAAAAASVTGRARRRSTEQRLQNAREMAMKEEDREEQQAAKGEEKRIDGTAERLEKESIEAMKSKALLIKAPLPERELTGPEKERMEKEQQRKEEGEAWDEQGLLKQTNWWRQVLTAGVTPGARDLEMMEVFLMDFLKVPMPSIDLILRGRLHRLLVAIIDAEAIRGEGRVEDQFHELARKAKLLEKKWAEEAGQHLFTLSSFDEKRRHILCGPGGALRGLRPVGGTHMEPRWMTARNENAGMAEFQPGMWWLNTTCAYRDGMIGNTEGYVSTVLSGALPTIVLEIGEERPTGNRDITTFVNEGPLCEMMLPLLGTLDKPIRVLRAYGLKSKLAPPAGVRYDGWYRILAFSHRRISTSTERDRFRVEVLFERMGGQVAMEDVLLSPLPSMLDEWEEYLAIRDDEVRTRRGVEEYESWHRREREEELERELWLKKMVAEEARKAAEEKVVGSCCVMMGEGGNLSSDMGNLGWDISNDIGGEESEGQV